MANPFRLSLKLPGSYQSVTGCKELSADFHNYGGIRPAMHPALLGAQIFPDILAPRALRGGRLGALGASPYL
jgi:hypothetical protein